MKNDKIRTICFMAFYGALYVVLRLVGNYIPFLKMPNGGSIEIELIALFVASYHLGWLKGLGSAVICLVLTFFTGALYYLNPAQFALDYILPLAVVGMASLCDRCCDFHDPEVYQPDLIRCILLAAGGKCSRFCRCLGFLCYIQPLVQPCYHDCLRYSGSAAGQSTCQSFQQTVLPLIFLKRHSSAPKGTDMYMRAFRPFYFFLMRVK